MSLGDLIQLGASLVAVLFVAWLVEKMGLGADPRITDADHAIRLAEEAEAGFKGVEVARDRAGFAAIVRNAGGRMMLMRGGEILLDGDARALGQSEAMQAAYFGYGEH